MKIGLICPYNITRGGGVQECVLAVQAELIERGHKVTVITPKPIGYKGVEPKGVRFLGVSADVKSPFHTTAQVSVKNGQDLIEKFLESEKFDILHFHEPWVPTLSRQLLLKSKAINIATFHAKFPDTVMSRTIEKIITPYTKQILKYFSALTAVSEAAASYASSLTLENINIIPNGINLSKYKPGSSSERKQQILYVGRLEKRKGLTCLLDAFSSVAKQNPAVQLILAGDGPDKSMLLKYVKENKIPRVQFLGYISENEKLEYLHESALFCSPALYGESFGIVLLEAMAAGVPIVAGNNKGYSGLMTGRGALALVDPKNTNEFASRLELFLDDKEIRQLFIKWAETYVKKFDYKNVVDEYEKLYLKRVQ